MGEKFTTNFEGQEGFITPEKPEPGKSPSEQPKTRDFLYDPQNQEILIFSKSKSGEARETRHPFQEFLYALREEEIKASTSEWIDLQKALAEGEIQSVDDLYVVSRAVLVKDITGYPKFDTVFGRMFYGVEPTKPKTEDEYNEEPEEKTEEETEQQEEKEEAEEENLSQEIVEPGLTEEHHGGEDVHKAIEDSKSSGHEGGGEQQQKSEKAGEGQKKEQEGKGQKLEQGEGGSEKKKEGEGGGKEKETGEGGEGKEEKETGGGKRKEKKKKQGIIKEGKGGYSARERVVERRYDQYDKDQKSEKAGEGQKKEQEGKGQKLEQGEGGSEKKKEGEGGGKEKETGEGGEGKEEKETGGGKRKEKKKKQGIIKEGKGGYSARERVVERR